MDKQVDILISKNQALQILRKYYTLNIMYIKFHKIIMDEKPQKFDPHEMNKHILEYKLLQHNKTQTSSI